MLGLAKPAEAALQFHSSELWLPSVLHTLGGPAWKKKFAISEFESGK